jgi:hypothetical protein
MAEQSTRTRPTYKRELLEEAKDATIPVTEVNVSKSGHTTRVHAIQESDGGAYRAQITHDERSDSPPRVQFEKCYWDSDVAVMQDWSSLATGSLPGPQDLPSWESMFTVFNAALRVYNRQVRDHVRTAGIEQEAGGDG